MAESTASAAVVWIERLKDTGLVPRHINPPNFCCIAKTLYQQADALILIFTLYKSVTHWKRRCETLEREMNARSSQNEVPNLKNEVAHLFPELALATQRRENTELLAEEKAAYHKLQLANESQKATLRNVFKYLGHVSDSLDIWTDIVLIPMKMHVDYALMLGKPLTAFPWFP